MENTCGFYENCPIFNNALHGMKMTAKNYKAQYCEAGISGWQLCKRFVVKEKTGKCPPNLLPNSIKSVEQIMESMN